MDRIINEIEEYSFSYKDKKYDIKTGKQKDVSGDMLYYAKSNFKNILSLAESKETALENCIKKIKFTVSLIDKKINLIDEKEAVILAKKYFQNYYQQKDILKNSTKKISYNIYVEDEILTFNITASKDVESSFNSKKLYVIAIIYVNLITGECDMIEKKNCQIIM